jgi:hypothetical protein
VFDVQPSPAAVGADLSESTSRFVYPNTRPPVM